MFSVDQFSNSYSSFLVEIYEIHETVRRIVNFSIFDIFSNHVGAVPELSIEMTVKFYIDFALEVK